MPGCRQFSRLGMFIVAVVVAVAACDSTMEPTEPEPLTLEEVEALYFGMAGLLADTTLEFISSTSDGGVVRCPLGGQVTVAASEREEMVADTSRLITNTRLDPDGCVLSSDGYEFTVDGNPNVLITLSIGIVEGTLEFFVDGSMTGGLDWKLDDRSGTCMIDLDVRCNPVGHRRHGNRFRNDVRAGSGNSSRMSSRRRHRRRWYIVGVYPCAVSMDLDI